ncbi:Beta-galactosidase BoGH2A [Pontiella desulfatans]|uniref:Beta-galactosidase BoGH2A n=1 Tax=Pontiella desulfatans TaxID=2750659 RepID=A0A6C2UBY3_PONDE|nr:glycoside hydrolase family 2 TIM barrel-domain containing protein [Pontiella desulfatans]VGO17565.1 Beta-galactosidase BoGH2A [Pontiella desulfatans]
MMSMSVNAGRRVEDFNRGWKFNLGNVPEAKAAAFDDSGWRGVKLPHDWSVELSFTNNAGGCTAWLPGGIGWYRKTFMVPAASQGKTVRVDFDGVYNNSDVWINGRHLGHRPYGYTPFSYDLSEHLDYGGENTIVVKADRSRFMDSRWYPGSGIYRNVKLVTLNKVRIKQHGVFITTPEVTSKCAIVQMDVTLENAVDGTVLKTVVIDPAGNQVADGLCEVVPDELTHQVSRITLHVSTPRLWDVDSPNLYKAVSSVLVGGQVVDECETVFGIRSIRYDAEEGFFLNGKNTLLKGVCLHHDGGCVGAAVPDGVWERRLRILKEGGCNAIRTAHNPPSEEFLDLCDRMGFLVQDEIFDEWFNPKDKKNNFELKEEDERTLGYSESYGAWAERDLKAMVLRDRNHPCIIMWSTGNEIEWTYPGYADATGYWLPENKGKIDYYWDEPPYSLVELKQRFLESKERQGKFVLAHQAADLSRWVKELDTSRPVTANLVMPSVSHFSGYADTLDIVGYSYRTVNYDWGHRHYPEKMILGTENWVQWEEWKAVLEKPFIPGIFVWTGINYMGESAEWPKRGNSSGMLDTAGFKRPNWWFFKTFWQESEPMVYIATQPLNDSNYLLENGIVVENPARPRTRKWGWPEVSPRWNHGAGEMTYVELYSNCEETELFLNGRSLGVRELATSEDRLLKWAVPFEAGELKAVGRTDGKETASRTLRTAGRPAAVSAVADRSGLRADGCDVAHLEIQMVDANGIPVRHMDQSVRFTIEGDARNIGVDNGSDRSVQDFQSDVCETHEGRCLMVLQAGDAPGPIQVTVSAEGLASAVVALEQN